MSSENKAGYGVRPIIDSAFVVFQGRVGAALPMPFTSSEFRHCWIMVPTYSPEPGLMAECFTIRLEAVRWGLDVKVWYARPDECAAHFLKLQPVSKIVKVPYNFPPKDAATGRLNSWRGPMTCVTTTKAILGVRAWKVWTPKQLFDYLVANQGTLIE